MTRCAFSLCLIVLLSLPAAAQDPLAEARSLAWMGDWKAAAQALSEAPDSPARRVLGLQIANEQGRDVLVEAERLLPTLGEHPDLEMQLLLMLLVEDRRRARTDMADRYLPRVRELAPRLGALGRLGAFAADTLAMQRKWHATGRLATAEFVEDNNRAFALLDRLPEDGTFARTALAWRHALELAVVWGEARRALEDELGALPELAAIGQADSSILLQQAPTTEAQLRTYRLEVLFALVEVAMSLNTAWRGNRSYADQLRQLQPSIEQMEGFARQLGSTGGDLFRLPGRYYQELGRDHLARGELTEAARHFAKARELYQAGQADPGLRSLLRDEVDLWMLTLPEGYAGRVSAALAELEPGASRPLLAWIYVTRGRLSQLSQVCSEDPKTLERALELGETYLREARGDRATLLTVRAAAELLAAWQAERGQAEQALLTRARADQIEALCRLDLNRVRSQDPARKEALERVAEAQRQLAASEARGIQTLAADRAQYYRAVRELEKLEPAVRSLTLRPGSLAQLQPQLPAGCLLVQYFAAPKALYIFLVRRDSLALRRVEVEQGVLEEAIRQYRRQAQIPQGDPSEAARRLSQSLLAPVQTELAQSELVAFVPSGSLLYLPFGALPLGERLLVEQKPVAVLTKATDLVTLARETGRPAGMLALGDPDGTLPAARREVERLSASLPGSTSVVGEQATVERLSAAEPPGYLHLATHGVLDPVDPLSSYLVMAPDPAHPEGRLHVSEIAGMSLHGVSLVTLSACQTGMAERVPDPGRDLASLADAFNFAGSPSVVASLWKVSDDSTALLMERFYAGLARGLPRAHALREAQLAVRAEPRFQHPFYWAGFVLIGDWR